MPTPLDNVHIRVTHHGILADVFQEDGSVRCFQLVSHKQWVEYPEAGRIPFPTNPGEVEQA